MKTNNHQLTTNNFLFFTSVFMLALSAGYLHGRTLSHREVGVNILDSPLLTVPTVTVHGIRNSKVLGSISGDVRVFLGNTQLSHTGSFAVAASELLVNVVDVSIPQGMHYVASRKGQKYYPVQSASANRLKPENRIYFRTELEAQNAGYRS